jgi:predicted O-linked N-acetylglucosamine transferase (SPINDLY family)
LFNQGNALFRAGEWQQACGCYERAWALDAAMEQAALQIARCAVKLGDWYAARDAFAALLKDFPNNYSGWLEAGHVCRQQGVLEQALACYERAVALAPDRHEAHLGATRVLELLGRFDAAAAHYQQALVAAGAKHNRFVHWRMAKYRLEYGDAARALESMRQALLVLRLDPASVDADEQADMQTDLGTILHRLGLTELAHRAYERASAATSEATLVRLADVSYRQNLWQESREVLRRNVQLHPDSATAHWNLADLLARTWAMQEALEVLAQAEALAPQPGAASLRANVAGSMGQADTALALYKELALTQGRQSTFASSAAMSSLYSDSLTAQEVADLHRQLFAHLGESARAASSFKNERSVARRLRVGLVSADFHHQHPVNIFMQPVLARLNPQDLEVTVYFTGVSYDEQTHLARQRVAHWLDVSTWNDAQLARRIEEDQIDILLDLAGHTSMQRMALFGCRAAPVQATFLGYPGSTGVPQIDWIVADAVVAPPGSEALFSERVMRLPNTVFCFAPEVDYPYPQYTEAHAQRPLTFGSFNNVPKLTPHTIALWAQVLKAVPHARLLLKAPSFKDTGAVQSFVQRFAEQGIGAERLEFRGPVGLSDMMAEYADVDIALDPVPYNGGTTTLQAMWMGVPVVVKAGNNFVSRMGASFMAAADLHDWVAEDDAAYVRIAVAMAQDRQALLTLKQGMRARLQSQPAWDIDRYSQDFSVALRNMWRTFAAENPAQ